MRRSAFVLSLCVACGAGGAGAPKTAAPTPPASCISEATARVLRSIRGTMTVEAFFTPGAKVDPLARRVEALLREYERRSGGKLRVEIVPVTSDQAKARAEKADVKPIELDDGSKAYAGVAFRYETESDAIAAMPADADRGLELWLTNRIRDLRAAAEKRSWRIGLATGNGEIAFAEPNLVPSRSGKPSMKEVIARNFSYFDLVDADLSKPIDDSLVGLVVTQPAADLSDDELRRLDDFVMKGKTLVVLASAVDVKAGDATMTATLALHGLDRLLGPYGVDLHRDVVLDFGGAYTVSVLTQSGLSNLHMPQLVALSGEGARMDTSFLPLFRLQRLVAPFASSLTVHPERQPRASVRVVARSSDKALVATSSPIGLAPVQAWRPRGVWVQADVGAVVEGRLTSAFSKAVSAGDARVFVLASSQVAVNPLARAGNGPDLGTGMPATDDPTLSALAGSYADMGSGEAPMLDAILFVKNTLDWITLAVDAPGLAGDAKVTCR